MKMEMEHALARLLPDVGDDPVAVQSQLLGELGDDLEDVGRNAAVVFRDFGNRPDVGLGNH